MAVSHRPNSLGLCRQAKPPKPLFQFLPLLSWLPRIICRIRKVSCPPNRVDCRFHLFILTFTIIPSLFSLCNGQETTTRPISFLIRPYLACKTRHDMAFLIPGTDTLDLFPTTTGAQTNASDLS
ncbi:hypothetical protein NXS19_002382 [Fusarium pseudograminearum]|nr:hypothetical protein NXS19_002382 [Fusarium pseudograminearum]